jgi:hypothetical protein
MRHAWGGQRVIRLLAAAGVVAWLFVACAEAPTQPASPLESGLTLTPIAEAVEREALGIDCGPPGGGGGSAGPGPNGGGLVHHRASLTCTMPGGTIARVAEPWGRLTGLHLESRGLRIVDPGSFDEGDGGIRGFTWHYTSGPWTGVLTMSIVPAADGTYRVLADLVEYGPG